MILLVRGDTNLGRYIKTSQRWCDEIGRMWTQRETQALAWVYDQLSILFRGAMSSWTTVIPLSAFIVSFLMISLECSFLLMKNKVKDTQLLRSFWFEWFILLREVIREQDAFSLVLTPTMSYHKEKDIDTYLQVLNNQYLVSFFSFYS